MAQVNIHGDPIVERTLFPYGYNSTEISQYDLFKVIDCLCKHLHIEIVKTNATKHGITEIIIRGVHD